MPMTRRILACLFCLAGIMLIAGCGGGSGAAIVRIGHGLPEDHPVHLALLDVRNYLAENGATDIDVRIYPNNQLGSSVDQVQLISSGEIEAGVVSAAALARTVPEMNVLNLPFLFRDTEHQREALHGLFGEKLLASLAKERMFGIGFFTAGTRNLMMKKAVRTPEDLAGLNVRVMESNMLVETIRAMGGSPVSMDMGEVYSALQQGVIDGWENNPPTAHFYRMAETGANHFTWTRHLIIPDVIVATERLRERLTEEQFALLEEAFAYAITKQWKDWETFTRESVASLEEQGMRFYEIDDDAFRARVEPVYEQAFARYGSEFRALVEEARKAVPAPVASMIADPVE